MNINEVGINFYIKWRAEVTGLVLIIQVFFVVEIQKDRVSFTGTRRIMFVLYSFCVAGECIFC